MNAHQLAALKSKIFGTFVAALALVLLAPAAMAQTTSLTLSKTISKKEQAASMAYWTRERIAAAPALPIPIDSGLEEIDPDAWDESDVTGPEESVAAEVADPDADEIARAVYAEDWAELEDEVTLEDADILGTSGVYTSYDVNKKNAFWKIYPHLWSGKLTFNTPTGPSSCSATAISGNNIVTAAHCVYDTTANTFYNSWAFTPAYRNGGTPYGTFPAQVCSVLTTWVNLTGSFNISTWTRHDVAVCTMNVNSAGQTLNGAVGWAGRLWNAGNNQLVFNSGYPARTYTDAVITDGPAQYLRSCTAETFLYTTNTLGSGCSWGRGISGGAWFVGYKPFIVAGQVNSVNSGLFIGQQNLYGARFNDNNIVVLCSARGC